MAKSSVLLLREFIGSLGDLGTLLPLTIGLIAYNGLDPTRAFVLLGVTYIAAGLVYRLPMPVQPLKATAMIAIAVGASRAEISAAAIVMAATLLTLGLTGVIGRLNDVFPRVLVRGLQFGLGALMLRSGIRFVLSHPMGVLATVHGAHAAGQRIVPDLSDFRAALFVLVLPQIPLTLGNSIVATHDCAVKYFADRAKTVTPRRLAITIALGNVAAGLLGGVPICHGAGGMTAHYRMGARTGLMGAMIGAVLVIAGIAARSAFPAMSGLPASVLGILLIYVGIRHAALASAELRGFGSAAVVLTMGGVTLVSSNMLYAIAAGLAVRTALRARQ